MVQYAISLESRLKANDPPFDGGGRFKTGCFAHSPIYISAPQSSITHAGNINKGITTLAKLLSFIAVLNRRTQILSNNNSWSILNREKGIKQHSPPSFYLEAENQIFSYMCNSLLYVPFNHPYTCPYYSSIFFTIAVTRLGLWGRVALRIMKEFGNFGLSFKW